MVTRPLSSQSAPRILAKQPDRVLRRAAEHAGVQIAVGACDFDVLIDQPAQRGGHRRRLGVPHGGVADQRQVELELGGVVAHEFEQVLRAALLLALDHGGDRQRQLAGDRLEGAAGLDEGHGLAFVVAGAARDDDLAAARQRLDARLERRGLPLVERIDRLDVIMAIKQHARAGNAVGFAHHHRMALGRADIGGKTDAAQVGGDVLGGGPACSLYAGSVETEAMRNSANKRSTLWSISWSMRLNTASSALMRAPAGRTSS